MKIYLAGPDVFFPNVKDIAKEKKRICEHYGATGLFPLDNKIDITKTGADLKIYLANLELMRQADICIANLTPFRGPSMDVGTAFEVGYMTALGKKVYGYSNDDRFYVERVLSPSYVARADHNDFADGNGYSIENFGNIDNLMIDKSIIAGSQKAIAKPVKDGLPDDCLVMFELAVMWAMRK